MPAKNKKNQKKGRVAPRKAKEPCGPKPAEQRRGKTTPSSRPVIGIGASAGGLDALKQFFTEMPPDTGAAFVIIQHLDPTHQSLTAELLSRHTRMSVVQVTKPMVAEPNHVYVIPPNRYLSISGGRLILTPLSDRGAVRMPVDYFLRSLAADCREQAIGVILSGTGTDGTLGFKEIKACGGFTLAQDPGTAQYDGMPRSAIDSGSVDHVLPIGQMPQVLVQFLGHAYVRDSMEAAVEGDIPAERTPQNVQAVLAILRTRAKFDFGWYKKGTLMRRIHRRMSVRHVDELSEYVQVLRRDMDEVGALFRDLLINVTSFFREPKSWEALRELAVKPIVDAKADNAPIRVWVPACASGEEAYSVAMLFLDELHEAKKTCPLHVFASDVDADALDAARVGVFPESIAADVPPDRLRRFFSRGEVTYRVNKELRESVVFATQNVMADPPFSKLDLICCRNLMIYLEGEVQKKVLALLHFALAEGGCLFLGTSESIGADLDLFETVSKKWRIYKRIGPTHREAPQFPILAARRIARSEEHKTDFETSGKFAAVAQQVLLDRYAPASVVVNRKGEILFFSGPTHEYLFLPQGAPTQDLLAHARDGLTTKLRFALQKAIREKCDVQGEARVKRGRLSHRVRFSVEHLKGARSLDGLMLVSFEEQRKAGSDKGTRGGARPEPLEETLVQQLEAELKSTREDLQSTIEELETSNEELKAANEEVMSVNEELQSTNEELETSKEELQSLNEELSTVNSQLEIKVQELETSHDDLNNLLLSTELATLFLDPQYRIRRFTPAITRLIRLIPTDLGRPISDFASPLIDGELLEAAERVLQQLRPEDLEVQPGPGRWYVRRILPYRTQDNRIAGVVITFTDVTIRKEAERTLQHTNETLEEQVSARTREVSAGRDRLEAILSNTADGIVTITTEGVIESFNRSAEKMFGYSAAEAIGKPLGILMAPPYDREHERYVGDLRTGEAKIIGVGREVMAQRKDGTTFPVDLCVTELHHGNQHLFIGSVRDLTDRKCREGDLREREQALADLSAREQRRIGAELHDQIGQILSGSAMLARGLESKTKDHEPAMAETASRLVTQLQDGYQRVRDLARGLAPVITHDQDLAMALAELAESTESMYHVRCEYRGHEVPEAWPIETAEHLYRIAQEAVSNAVRHGHPRGIWITLLKEGEDEFALTVRDDGNGLPQDRTSSRGLGLRIMQHRADLIGGKLEVLPGEESGTVIRCTIRASGYPLRAAGSSEGGSASGGFIPAVVRRRMHSPARRRRG